MGPAAQGVRMIWVSFLLVFTFFMILALVANIGMEKWWRTRVLIVFNVTSG